MPSLAALLDDTWRELSPRDRVLHEIWDEVGLTGEEASASLTTPTTPPCSLVTFVQEAWSVIEPQPYIHGWHIDAICAHLEAVSRRDIRNLLINVPPRSSKSLITAVLWPAWTWSWWPAARFIFASYSEDLSLAHSVLCRDLVQSVWYQRRFQPTWHLHRAEKAKSFFSNNARGFRMATSVRSQATGYGADFRVADDLHSVTEDLSDTRADIQMAVHFWNVVMPSRVTNPKEACSVVVGQRVAEDDVSGVLLTSGAYEYLCIAAEYEPPGVGVPQSQTSLNWHDPRTVAGEPMCPARYGADELAALKGPLGYRFFAQYQQRPTSDASTLFRRADWKRYDTMPPLDWFDMIIQSWDMAVKNEETSSYYAGHVWGKRGADVILLDRVWQRMDFPEGIEAVKAMSSKWPSAYGKLIEDKGNGTPTLRMLRGQVYGLIPVNPQGDGNKRARAQAVAYVQRGGNAWVPSDRLAPWASQYIENMARLQWDDVDATSQAWAALAMPSPALDEARQAVLKARELRLKITQAAHRNGHGEHSRSHV